MPLTTKVLIVALLFFLLSFTVNAQQNPDLASPQIVINLPSRTLEFYAGPKLIKEYPIAVGKPSTPSPLGEYVIINKEVNPAWYPPHSKIIVPSGPDNPLGYRWMGFLPTYGIHGTNAPWAIGGAVSNGCIRMLEPDVEELFEMVPYGTPVNVTYDRIRVRISDKGLVTLAIYPDIYGWQPVNLAQVQKKLAVHGVDGLAADDFVISLIREEPDRPVPFAQMVQLKVNDTLLVEPAIRQNDKLFVPVRAVAGAFQIELVWDEVNQVIRSERRIVPGIVRGKILYTDAEKVQVLFGGQKVWKPEDNLLEINVLSVFVNNKPLTKDVQVIDGVLAIPLKPLAASLSQNVQWDSEKKAATLQGVPIEARDIDGQPYIKITRIYDSFGTYVYWNEQARSIELTYPFKVEGGSD